MFVFNCFPIAKLDAVEKTNKKTPVNSFIFLRFVIFVEIMQSGTLENAR